MALQDDFQVYSFNYSMSTMEQMNQWKRGIICVHLGQKMNIDDEVRGNNVLV